MSLRIFSALLCALLLTVVCCVAHAGPTVTLSTGDNRFESSTPNQGWWSSDINTSTDNPIWFAGTTVDKSNTRSFATFLLPDFDKEVVAATLKYRRWVGGIGNEPTETIGFFDVSTNPEVLNTSQGRNNSIFEDLGTGVSYGEITIPGSGPPTELLDLPLNANALAAINAIEPGYFSIGGRLLSDDGNDGLFAGGVIPPWVQLTLTLVPEPATGAIAATTLSFACVRRRKRC